MVRSNPRPNPAGAIAEHDQPHCRYWRERSFATKKSRRARRASRDEGASHQSTEQRWEPSLRRYPKDTSPATASPRRRSVADEAPKSQAAADERRRASHMAWVLRIAVIAMTELAVATAVWGMERTACREAWASHLCAKYPNAYPGGAVECRKSILSECIAHYAFTSCCPLGTARRAQGRRQAPAGEFRFRREFYFSNNSVLNDR
jgi:hypothetical protein